jgi:hypothetical protein
MPCCVVGEDGGSMALQSDKCNGLKHELYKDNSEITSNKVFCLTKSSGMTWLEEYHKKLCQQRTYINRSTNRKFTIV